MPSYHKTYRTFRQKRSLGAKRFRVLPLMAFIGILIVDSIFFILKIARKFALIIILNSVPAMQIIAQGIFHLIILPIYGFILVLNRKQRAFFVSHSNKLFFLFTNRYVSHTVAVLVILITIVQNISIRTLRAEDFWTKSILPKLSPGQITFEESREEEIVIPNLSLGEATQETEFPPAVTPRTPQAAPSAEPSSILLSEDGAVITKPDIAETFDTPKPRERVITYNVLPEDTIYGIAEKFNISVNTVLWSNKLSARSIIRPGDEIIILPVTGVLHIVKSGQTISSIAALYSVPKDDIIEVNHLNDDGAIQIGVSLLIPDGHPPAIPAPKRRPTTTVPEFALDRGAGSGGFLWPTVCRRITQYFMGWRHTGVDIACEMGANVYASEEGTVEKAGFNRGGYGNHIILKHSDGSKTLYAHLKAGGILVSPGEYVKKGQVIGLMGSTGRSTGAHLHFEIIINGTRVNPFNRL